METSKKQVKRLANPDVLEARIALFPVGLIAAMKQAVDTGTPVAPVNPIEPAVPVPTGLAAPTVPPIGGGSLTGR